MEFNRRVSSNVDELERLHHTFHWIPGRDMIRPKPEILTAKWAFMEMQEATYVSFVDAVLIMVFGIPSVTADDGRLEAGES
jgi:hypothetical protein